MAIQVEDVNDASEITNVKGDSGALHVKNVAVEPGHDSTFDRTWGGARATPVRVTTSTQVVSGAAMFYGFTCTAGTSPTLSVYNGTSTAGTLVYGGATSETLGSPKSLVNGGGVYCSSGVYAVVGGTSVAYTAYVGTSV